MVSQRWNTKITSIDDAETNTGQSIEKQQKPYFLPLRPSLCKMPEKPQQDEHATMAHISEHHPEHQHITYRHEKSRSHFAILWQAISLDEQLKGSQPPCMSQQYRHILLGETPCTGEFDGTSSSGARVQAFDCFRNLVFRNPSRDQNGRIRVNTACLCLIQPSFHLRPLT